MKKFAVVAGIGGLIYLAFCYVNAEWNPINFSREVRIAFSVAFGLFSGAALGACCYEERT